MANYDGDITLTVDLEPGDIQSVTGELQERIKDIVRNPGGMQVTKGFKQLQTTMVKATERADKLLKQMRKLEGVEVKTEEFDKLDKAFDELLVKGEELEEQIRQRAGSGFNVDTDQTLQKWIDQYNQLTIQINDTYEARQHLIDTGQDWIPGEETQEYANLTQQLNSLNNQMTVSVERAESMSASMGRVPEALSTARTFFVNLGSAVAKVFSLLGNLGPVLRTVASKLAQVASAAAKAATNLIKMAGSTVAKGIRSLVSNLGKLASSLKKTHKSTDSASDAFKKGLKTLIKYTFGVRSFFFLWRKMRKALSEGIGNLAQYSEPFNQTISDLMGALTRLKNSFATAFAPIMEVVVPILTTFINVVSEVVTRIGMLIAALTGKTTFIRAKAVQEDYAASLDKAAGSASDAAKANKEYEKTIAGFDDVEILKDPTKDSSGSGGSGGSGGGSGVSPADMFETVNIPSAFHNWADMIKKAWEEADFTTLGDILGQKIAKILNNLPWEDIQKNAQNFGQSFATFVNGVISVDGLAYTVGSTIGEAINTGLALWQGFIEPFDFDELGTFIGNTMNGMVITTDWDKLADDIIATANGVFKLASTWADVFDFDKLGEEIEKTITKTLKGIEWKDAEEAVGKIASKIASALNKIMTEDTFKSVGKAIGSGINMAVTGVTNFVSGIEWDNWGENLAAGVNEFFKTVNWDELKVSFETVAKALAKGIKAACKVTNTFLTDIDWDAVATTLSASVNVFFATLSWDDLKVTFNNAARALAGGIKTACALTNTFLGGIEWDKVATTLSSSVNIFFSRLNWEELEVTFNNVARAVANGIKTGISTVHTFITDVKWEEVGKTVGSSVNTFFETLNWEEIGVTFGGMALGIANFIMEAIKTIDFETVGADVATAFTSVPWDTLFTKAGELVEASAKALEAFLNGLLGKFGEALTTWYENNVPQAIKDFIDNIITAYKLLTGGEMGPGVPETAGGTDRVYGASTIKEGGETQDVEYHGIAMSIVRGIQKLLSGEEGEGLEVEVNAVELNDNIPPEQKDVDGEVTAIQLHDFIPKTKKKIGQIEAEVDTMNPDGLSANQKIIPDASAQVTDMDDKVPTGMKIIDGAQVYVIGMEDKILSAKELKDGKILIEDCEDGIVKVEKIIDGFTGKVVEPKDAIAVSKKQIGSFKVEFNDYKSSIPEAKRNAGIGGFTVIAEHLNQSFIPEAEKLIDSYAKITETDKGKTIKDKNRQMNNFKAVIASFKSGKKATGKTQSGFTGTLSNYKEAPKNVKGKTQDGFTGEIDDYDEARGVTGKNPSGFVAKVTEYDVPSKKVSGFTAVFNKVEGLEAEIRGILSKFGIKTATGGAYYSGSWHSIAQYATGGVPTHGTVFVAGEAGAEAVGHIGNRTEVLNQSQMAAVMYSAVLNGTASLVKTITNYMALCTNTLITNIGTIISQAGYISSQLAELHNLGNVLTTTLTDIVVGKIIPSTYTNNANNNTLNKILDVLQYNQSNMVTRDELEGVLRTSFERYMNIGFYIGDEQIARHANAGNAKLNYRFNPVR